MTVTATKLFDFDNTLADALPELVLAWAPVAVPNPELVAFNPELAASVAVDPEALGGEQGLAVLAGNDVPDGTQTVAMAYAGHQFGQYSPRLGDGRALLLGEVIDGDGNRVDLHLKGSGRTPFSRGGDGKATVGPMLREYLMAEAMHALGIPTGRALAVVTTGEQIMRRAPEPGAVLTRVAASHLRVGTFEYAVRLEDRSVVRRLADYAIERHYPALAGEPSPQRALLAAVVDAQASLVARWMLVGFIHGVMNTDNMTISGETIDYGPCAFLDRYDQRTVYSSIDHQGRYAFGNQPTIAHWNLSRLAETLLPVIAEHESVEPESLIPDLTEMLDAFGDRFRSEWAAGMRSKLGLVEAHEGADGEGADPLLSSLVETLQEHRLDYTSFFRSLAAELRGGASVPAEAADWVASWRERLSAEGRDPHEVADAMDAVNPIYIPRNHLVDEALAAAESGDMSPFNTLLDVVTDPFTERDGLDRYAEPAPEDFDRSFRTFCGT